jgi:hypothetical protein
MMEHGLVPPPKINSSIIVAMDSDVLPPQGWLEWLLYRMAVQGYECVAGPLRGLGALFWDVYIDKTNQGKTPRIRELVELTIDILGKWKPPVTANLAFTFRLWRLSGGSRPNVKRSYEDYTLVADFFRAVPHLKILLDPYLSVDREHRTGLKALRGELRRSGTGCQEFLCEYPDSLFAVLRLLQLAIIPLVALGLAIALVMVPETVAVLLMAAVVSQMAANVMIARKIYAIGFPFINWLMSFDFITGVSERYTLRGFKGYPAMPFALGETAPVRNTPISIDDLFPRGGEA